MSLNDTVSGDRIHIGFFGRRNAGKSSLVNAFTGQQLSVVSDVRGTTTDPVRKAMELLPLGPVLIIDTPGIDDEGALGELRVQKAREVLQQCDIALLVAPAGEALHAADRELLHLFEAQGLPYLIVRSKCDLLQARPEPEPREIYVSAETQEHLPELKERVGRLIRPEEADRPLVGDLLSPGDLVVLVTPIDSAAPKGRLILPQQQTIRDILDHDASAVVTKETELAQVLSRLAEKPRLVITDSQAFGRVAADVPADLPLTSFSILFARHKGDLAAAVAGAAALDALQDDDTVLISEGCTHHRQCDDIGTVKLPRWIQAHTGREIRFSFTAGRDFPEDLSPYRLVIHCGGCTLTPREMRFRQQRAAAAGIPMTNYGTAIAHIHGILPRALAPFPQIAALLSRRQA